MPAKTKRKPQTVAEIPPNSILLGSEKLKQLYSTMLQCRMITAKARTLFHQPMFETGREAVEVGCTLDLKPEDYLVACRNPAASYVQGMALNRLFARLYAQPFPHDPALQLKIGMGMSLLYQKQSKPFITLALADDCLDQDMLNHAETHKLPIIFVVCKSFSGRNNGIPVIAVDANDAVAIHRVSQETIRRAREGHGPAVIACHIEADSNPDPLDFMENYLRQRNLWSTAWKERLVKDFSREIDVIVSALKRFC